MTLIAQVAWPSQANGSLIYNDQTKEAIGSKLIGQSFTSDKYFWGRVSATTPFPYNAASSAASNYGPSNPDFLQALKDRTARLSKISGNGRGLIPADLVTSSGSGVDPEISPYAAYYQIPRIAKARGVSEKTLRFLVEKYTQSRTLTILGEPRVNVLELNIALDQKNYINR